jgi:hypothetical protein
MCYQVDRAEMEGPEQQVDLDLRDHQDRQETLDVVDERVQLVSCIAIIFGDQEIIC